MSAYDATTATPAEAPTFEAPSLSTQGTPALDYTRVTSLLNPMNPPVGTQAPNPFSLPKIYHYPAPVITSVLPAIGIPTVGTATLNHIMQSPQIKPQDLPVSPAPSTGNTPPAEAAITNDHMDTAYNSNNEGSELSEAAADSNNDNSGSSAIVSAGSFRCMNDEFEECRTGQTTMDLSRKVISDHFGRNKACTRLITDWPLFCRKHYQRATYNQKLWQARKITLILRQFDIIEDQFPGTKYTVALKKSEESRLNTFSRKIAAGVDLSVATALVAPEKGKHFEAPVEVLREIEQLNYLGKDKKKFEVEAAVNSIRDMLENEDTEQVPSIEFLPQLDADGRPFDASSRNKKSKKSTPRVSAKGAIQKTSDKTPKSSKKGSGKV